MTYEHYLERVIKTIAAEPHWRLGQTVFNVLFSARPDLSERIRATKLDPFYAQTWEDVSDTLDWIRENW